jgi:argininosuccinate synthase
MSEKAKKVVLAYSGGLSASIIIPWLKENYGCEVIAMVGQIGQEDGLHGLEEKALRSGASKCYVEDLRHEFVTEYLWSLVRSGARYEGTYLLGTAIARPVLAKRQVEVALAEGADSVAHGCTGKGNDQIRFELAYKALAPDLRVITPWRLWDIASRQDALAYARERNIPIAATSEKIHSRDSNLWHMSHEGAILEDPSQAPPEGIYMLTLDPRSCPEGESEITIDFEKGVPVGLNGYRIRPVQLLEDLNEIAGTNGIGRLDCVENRVVGMKSRGVYETPGGTLIASAHRELESLCLDRQTRYHKDMLGMTYAQLVYDGHWFTPLREALDAFFLKTQEVVTGSVTLALYRGTLAVKSRKSPFSLCRHDLASLDAGGYHSRDAEGFINLVGLPASVRSRLNPGNDAVRTPGPKDRLFNPYEALARTV